MKTQEIPYAILHILLMQEDYITIHEIADMLGVSRKTIVNHMNKVEEDAIRKGLHFHAKKGKGIQLLDDPQLKHALAADTQFVFKQPLFHKERDLYMLHLLLNESDMVRISELESILHLSRPSIYKACDEVKQWLSRFNIQLHATRNQGLVLDVGEKRHRLAITKWMMECKQFLNEQKERGNYFDSLKLEQCYQMYEKRVSNEKARKLIRDIEKELNIALSSREEEQLQYNLQIMLVRYQEGYTIKLPKKRIQLIHLIDHHHVVQDIIYSCEHHFHITISELEAMYFFSMIVASDSYQDINLMKEYNEQEGSIDALVLAKIQEYLEEHIHLSKEHKQDFMEQLLYIMQKELVYQIHEKQQAGSDYYASISQRFTVLSVFAKELAEVIMESYDICYYEKFIYNVTLLLATIVEEEKQSISCLLIHECNRIELAYIEKIIATYFINLKLVKVALSSELETLNIQDYDLLLTTIPLPEIKEVPVQLIRQTMNYHDILLYNANIHEYYQRMNFERIIKDKRLAFPTSTL